MNISTPYYLAQLREALPEINSFFEMSTQKVYKQIDLSKLFNEYHITWHIYPDMPLKVFIKHICENTPMKKVELFFGKSKSRKETRYLWGDASIYELAFSFKNHSYFTHHTAAYLLGLIESTPKTIYLNSEQTKRTSTSNLSQEAIDLAFSNSVRISNNRAQYENKIICLLNGMYTGQLGVNEIIGEKGEKIYLTGIERTLIDIAVRPVYSGGVAEVLNIYRRAFKKTSIRCLHDIYKKLDYVYPYHQVIGFYLDRAGVYEEKAINLFYTIDKPFNFYLTHKIDEKSYSEKWRLFYPKELDLGEV